MYLTDNCLETAQPCFSKATPTDFSALKFDRIYRLRKKKSSILKAVGKCPRLFSGLFFFFKHKNVTAYVEHFGVANKILIR